MSPRKKLSNFSKSGDWSRDSNNYVAKRYMGGEQRGTYFEVIQPSTLRALSPSSPPLHPQDVKLQMDAKLWAEEYNRHNPPKKVAGGQGGVVGRDDMADTVDNMDLVDEVGVGHLAQVDIFSMGVVELVDRPGAPLYHVEHYIDGEYIKVG